MTHLRPLRVLSSRSRRSWVSGIVVRGLSGYCLLGLRWGPSPVRHCHGRSMTQHLSNYYYVEVVFFKIFFFLYNMGEGKGGD
jgi:hypothetical protein